MGDPSMDVNAQRVSFWSKFLADPLTNQKSKSFPLLLWNGIVDQDNRKRVWRYVARRQPSQVPQDEERRRLQKNTQEEISVNVDVELEQLRMQQPELSKNLDQNFASIKKILYAHAERNSLERYEQGLAMLVVILLSACKDEAVAIDLLQYVTDRLRDYRANNNQLLLNDILLLADVMARDLPQLCQHFNSIGFDVVDLSDVVCNWCVALYASYFPEELVLRVMDIFVFEGPEALVAIAYGIFKIFVPEILMQSPESLFEYLSDMPNRMDSGLIQDAIRFAYDTFRKDAVRVADVRAKKDWFHNMKLAPSLLFVEGVGNPELLPDVKQFESKLGELLISKDRGASRPDDLKAPANGSDAMSDEQKSLTPGPVSQTDILFRLERFRQQTLDSNLKKTLEDAQREVRRQNDEVARLQKEIKAQEERMQEAGLSNDASSAESSQSSGGEEEDQDGRASGTPDAAGSPASGGRKRDKTQAEMAKRGFVKYSKLFQHQQFPCLYMEGYLLKARKKGMFQGKGLFGSLHRRFFVLQGAFITYFKSHRNSKPSKDLSVDMRGRVITKVDKHKFGKYGFEISEKDSKQCLYLLFASNADERNVWVQVLHAAAES